MILMSFPCGAPAYARVLKIQVKGTAKNSNNGIVFSDDFVIYCCLKSAAYEVFI